MKRVRGHTLRDWLAGAAPGDGVTMTSDNERASRPVAIAAFIGQRFLP